MKAKVIVGKWPFVQEKMSLQQQERLLKDG
jgi:hypothetical protein